MKKIFTLAAAALALAGAAQAEVFSASVTVPVAGRTAAEVDADLRHAAKRACWAAAAKAGPTRITSDADCRSAALKAARATVRTAANSAPPSQIAAN